MIFAGLFTLIVALINKFFFAENIAFEYYILLVALLAIPGEVLMLLTGKALLGDSERVRYILSCLLKNSIERNEIKGKN